MVYFFNSDASHVDELLPDVRAVVGVGVVGVHVLDGLEDALRVERVVVLVDVVPHHRVEEVPVDVVVRGEALVVVCGTYRKTRGNEL